MVSSKASYKRNRSSNREIKKDRILNLLKSFFQEHKQHYSIQQVVVYGSFARGDEKVKSDVDICITNSCPDPFLLVEIKNKLEKLTHRKIDLIRMHQSINPLLKYKIKKDHIEIL